MFVKVTMVIEVQADPTRGNPVALDLGEQLGQWTYKHPFADVVDVQVVDAEEVPGFV